MKEKLKLKPGEQVLCYDGHTIMDIATVKSVDKVKGEATLSNGIICKRESKENNFKRADYMAKTFDGFIKKLDNEAQAMYDAWIFKQGFLRRMENLTKMVQQKFNLAGPQLKALARGEDEETMEYIKKAKKLIEKVEKELL
ncbi:MAG: hypothetical protein NC131_06165 [Roseburia sp.]|nr:hypothetical protein [Roseburia sp.]